MGVFILTAASRGQGTPRERRWLFGFDSLQLASREITDTGPAFGGVTLFYALPILFKFCDNLKYCLRKVSPTVPLMSQYLLQNNLYSTSVLTCTPLFSNSSPPWHVFFSYVAWNSGGQRRRPRAGLVRPVSFISPKTLKSHLWKNAFFLIWFSFSSKLK